MGASASAQDPRDPAPKEPQELDSQRLQDRDAGVPTASEAMEKALLDPTLPADKKLALIEPLLQSQLQQSQYAQAASTLKSKFELERELGSSKLIELRTLVQLIECHQRTNNKAEFARWVSELAHMPTPIADFPTDQEVIAAVDLAQRLIASNCPAEVDRLCLKLRHELVTANRMNSALDVKLRYVCGQACFLQQAWERSRSDWLELMNAYRANPSLLDDGVVLHAMGLLIECSLKQTKYEDAESECREALSKSIAVYGDANATSVNLRRLLGWSLVHQRKLPEAMEVLNAAWASVRSVEKQPDHLTLGVLSALSSAEDALGDSDRASDHLSEMVRIYETRGQKGSTEWIHYNLMLADICAKSGRRVESADIARNVIRSMLHLERDRQPLDVGQLVNALSRLEELGHYQEAGEVLSQLETIVRGQPNLDLRLLRFVLSRLSQNYNWQSLSVEAESVNLKLIQLASENEGDTSDEMIRALNSWAVNLLDQSKFADAERVFRHIVSSVAQQPGADEKGSLTYRLNLAHCLQQQAKFDESIEEFSRLVTDYERLVGPEAPATGLLHNNFAYCFYSAGRYDEAQLHFQEAIRIWRAANEGPIFAAQNGIGMCLMANGHFDEAERILRENLDSRAGLEHDQPEKIAVAAFNLAKALRGLGKHQESLKMLEKALAAETQQSDRLGLRGLARSTSGGKTKFNTLVAMQAHLGLNDAAWNTWESGLASGLWEEIQSLRAREDADETLRRLRELQSELSRTEELRELRAANEGTAQNGLEFLDSKMNKLREEIAALRAGLRDSTSQTRSAPNLEEYRKSLAADSAFIGWVDLPRAPGFPSEAMDHWACIVRKSGPIQWVRLTGGGPNGEWGEDDRRLASELAETIRIRPGTSTRRDTKDLTSKLYRQRLLPCMPYLEASTDLPRVKRLVVLPSEAMIDVPMELLASDFVVSYAPSAALYAWSKTRALESRRESKDTLARALIVADPQFEASTQPPIESHHLLSAVMNRSQSGNEQFEALPGTRVEADAIAKSAVDHHIETDVLLGDKATVSSLNELQRSHSLEEFDYVHIATHAIPDRQRAMKSYFVLGGEHEAEDSTASSREGQTSFSRVTAENILLNWKLNSRLTVLSACQTGIGPLVPGEGRLGFAQALLVAGSRTVVLSQWKVDDTATALLMARFYSNLFSKGERSTGEWEMAESLDQAKRWLRNLERSEADALLQQLEQRDRGKKTIRNVPIIENDESASPQKPFSDPYYWAGFILTGDPGN